MNPTTINIPSSTDASQFGDYSDWAQQEMAKGFTPDQLHQSLAENGINLQPQQPAQAAAPQSKPNFLERLLPTAGGVLGGIAGSFLGGVGGIGGAAAGGALGQELENKLTGTKGSTKTAAAENAIGMGVGGALGKLGSLFAGRVVAPLAEKGATQLVAGQAPGVTKDLAEYLVKDTGLTDLNKAGQVADMLTGGYNQETGAILNKFVEDTLANNGPQKVQVSDLAMSPLTGKNAGLGEVVAGETNTLQKLITNNSLASTPAANAIRSKISGILKGVEQDAGGNTDPLTALNAQRKIAQLADEARSDYINSGRSDATSLNVYKTYNDLSNELKSRLKLGDIPVTPEDQAALAKDVETQVGAIDKNAGKVIADEIRNANGLTLSGVRNLESNWVQVKSALQQAADQANKNFGKSTADIAKQTLPVAGAVAGVGGPKSVLGTIGGIATSSPAADRTGAKLLEGVAKTSRGKLIQQVLPLATRAATIGAANLPNIAESGAGASPLPANNVSSTTGATMTPTAMGGSSPIEQVFQTLLQQEQASPANFASTLGPALASLAPTLQKQELAAGVAGNLIPSYEAAGGPGGMGGGFLSQLSAMVPGTAANAYQRQQQATASTLAQILGISPGAAMQLTPTLMQSPATAGVPVGNLNSILGTIGAF